MKPNIRFHYILLLVFWYISPKIVAQNEFDASNRNQNRQEFCEELYSHTADINYLLLGEIHGIEETWTLVYDIIETWVKSSSSPLIFLEIERSNQFHFDRFFEQGDTNFLIQSPFFNSYTGGWNSKAMFSFIKKLREFDRLNVLCYDTIPETISERDSLMAEFILQSSGGISNSIIIGGNYHTMDYIHKGITYYLRAKLPPKSKSMALMMHYESGFAWMLDSNKHESFYPVNIGPEMFKYGKNAVLINEVYRHIGHDGVIIVPLATPSPPYKLVK